MLKQPSHKRFNEQLRAGLKQNKHRRGQETKPLSKDIPAIKKSQRETSELTNSVTKTQWMGPRAEWRGQRKKSVKLKLEQ